MMSPLELTANIFNLASVFLANRNKVHTWWVGIIGTALFAVVFYQVKLYADVTLQIFFIATSIYGWRNWVSGGVNKTELPITRITLTALTCCFLASIVVVASYGFLLFRMTDASYPYIDSMVLIFSVVAQLLLMARKLETWIFWILVDIIAVPLFASKELYLTAIVYFGFLVNAVFGLINWARLYRSTNEEV